MERNSPEYWITHLHRSHVNGGAPHKPILMLAVLQLIHSGHIVSPIIRIDKALLLRFDELWKSLVNTQHKRSFALPFFHMKTEPFWVLHPKQGRRFELTSSKSIKSFSALNNALEYARLDDAFFEAASNTTRNLYLQNILCKKYFDIEAPVLTNENQMEREIEAMLLYEPPQLYPVKKKDEPDEIEEFEFIRSASFKEAILKVYDFTCSISGYAISGHSSRLVDACHIKPFAEFGIDHVTNGFCLTPTLHRAFDRGVITVADDFTVRVSKNISESDSPYNLSQFDGASLHLPTDQRLHPLQENFEWHREYFAKYF